MRSTGDADIVADARRVLEDGVRRIGAEIRQSLDFHHMQTEGAPVSRAVLTGPAIAVPGFTEALGAELGLETMPGTVSDAPDGTRPGDLTIAAGLAIAGAPAVNLLPAEERRAAGAGGRSGGAVYALLGALALGLVLLTSYVMAGNSISSKEDELAAVTVKADQAEQTQQTLAAYTDFASLRARAPADRPQPRCQPLRLGARARRDLAHGPRERLADLAERLGRPGRQRLQRRARRARRPRRRRGRAARRPRRTSPG